MTTHAAERFREYVPALQTATIGRAKAEAINVSKTARKTVGKTSLGQEIWEATDGVRVLFVVKDDRGERICVTILPPEASPVIDDDEGSRGNVIHVDPERRP